jgi:N-acetylmuramoyl-L-alanine amidase
MTGHISPNALLTRILTARGIKVIDKSGETHSIQIKYPLYRRASPPIGIVMHNTTLNAAPDSLLNGWRTREPFPPSHLAIGRDGSVAYYVQLGYADRATEWTNRHIGIEFQAVDNGDLEEDNQMKSAAIVCASLHDIYGMPLQIANTKEASGLSHHSLGVNPKSKDAHTNCPGKAIVARKARIIEMAEEMTDSLDFGDEPTGKWEVIVQGDGKRWVYHYRFDAEGTVFWRDPFNGRQGSGTWTSGTDKISLKWFKSKTIETWNLPLKKVEQEGSCQFEGMAAFDLTAKRVI